MTEHTIDMIEHTIPLPASVPEGRRIVVIGDVHGNSVLFRKALSTIKNPETATLLLTGDLVDRGPDSIGCLELARNTVNTFKEVIMLPGNHEQMMWLGSKDPKGSWAACFLMNGGNETLSEFDGDWASMLKAVPEQIIDRLEGSKPLWHREGEVLFIHAGINPDVPADVFLSTPADPGVPPMMMLEENSPLWVREPFYANPTHLGPYVADEGRQVLVVYGHSRIGTRDPAVLADRVNQEIKSWRFPVDASGSGMITVSEFIGNEVTMRIVV